ncbi:MAG: hypothetical protein HN377_09005, partial [Alphaproteobacteria bacterium]|nr:hypothetical protein [Alphaproteobacteria bacterium]
MEIIIPRSVSKIAVFFCLIFIAGQLNATEEVYAPDVGEGRYIITPKAAATPRINGPSIFGVRPGNPFLYAIPATGDRPMEFSVKDLPAGLTVNPDNGHITGRITSPEKKTYNVKLRVNNSKGSDAKAFRIVVGDQIALTPPLGWNSWNCWHQKVSQEKVLESAKAMSVAGLQRVGWMYINMDDGWQAKRGGKHNAVMPNVKFPDMKGMVDQIHAMGFKAGIYHTPWVGSYAGYCGGSSNQKDGHDWPTDSVDGVGDKARYNYFHIGEHKFDKQDTLQWADWGIDYLKDDWVLARDITPAAVARRKVALRECGRDIVYSLSNTGPLKFAEVFENDSNAWRISADIRGDWDTRGRGAGSIIAIMNLMKAWAPYCGPGHYPDADMMVVDGVHGGKPAKLTGDEQYSHVSLWALWSSPMLLGSAVDKMGEFGLSILSNPEVLEIHQDALCKMATIKNSDPFGQVWVKPLENGDTALGLINVSDEPRVITADWVEIGVTGKKMVRDLWRQRNIQEFDGSFAAMVPPHGTVLVRLSKPSRKNGATGAGMKSLPQAPVMTRSGTETVRIKLESDAGTTIHFTTDGSRPTAQSPVYTAPLTINAFTIVKAVAVKGGVQSGINTMEFCVATKSIPAPDVVTTELEKVRSYTEWRDVNINKTGRHNAPLKYKGMIYEQGLGIYGAGNISYPLEPHYQRFVAMVCLDDASAKNATGRFLIEIDGKVASASPIMKAGDDAWLFDVEIPKGAKTIKLVCYRDGVGPDFMFNFMNCGFIVSAPAQVKTISPSADKPPLPEVSLADLNELNVKNGWRQWQKNKHIDGKPLQIGETVYQQGLGLHANAEISYALKPEWKRFVATVGVHANVGEKGSVQFIVEVDGKVLGRSPIMNGKSPAHHFNIALPNGAQQIRLISSDGGDDITYDHANWVNCGFTISNDKESAESGLQSFKSGRLWPDSNGVHINAHGGGILFHKDTYYWFGEHKVAGTAGNRAQVGVHVYSSKDLCNWKDEGVALKVSDDPKSDIAKGCILERPKVIYNTKTGKFVMWFHLELKGQGYRSARSGIAVADKPCGPYKFVRSIRPNAGHWPLNVTDAQKDKASIERTKKEKDSFSGGQTPKHEQFNILGSHFEGGQMARDMNLFVDDDGKAYHIY